ncbi:kinase-like protein [Fomitiporia mediterranea MF3/22]|uniref:kinase-like protein n=1 Tax=Fomitiporia mediterranea (strain MF3/22) TaxID=694068 RepID=UPI0004408D27|nr:kinase-like protein [Fomitiporia mediterranea MF3/22]EJD04920.1 kinase-like protein [Fomitiporia mediterranea MF3/22]
MSKSNSLSSLLQNQVNDLSESQKQQYLHEAKQGVVVPALAEQKFGELGEENDLSEIPHIKRMPIKTLKPADPHTLLGYWQRSETEFLLSLKDNPDRPSSIMRFIEAFWSSEDTEYQLNAQGVKASLGRRICLVCEYIEGATLCQMLLREEPTMRRGKKIHNFPMKDKQDVKSILRQVLTGLSFLCDNRILTTAIRLENIMVIRNKRRNTLLVKIIDFGFVTRDPTYGDAAVCGTPLYFPPEIAVGTNENWITTHKTDMWALGVVFWEMIHGSDTFPIDVMVWPTAQDHYLKKKG